MGRNVLTYTEADYLIRELPDLLAQSIYNTQSTTDCQKIGKAIVQLSGLGNKCLWVLKESTKADGRAANKFYEYEKTTLEDFATKYAKSRLTNSLNDLKEAFNMLNDTLNAEYNIENAKNYFSKTAEVKSDIADSSNSISFDKSSKPLKIYDDQLKSSIDDHNTIMNQQQNLKQYIKTNINYQKKPIFGGGFPQHNTFGQTGAGFPQQPGFPNQGGFPTNTTNTTAFGSNNGGFPLPQTPINQGFVAQPQQFGQPQQFPPQPQQFAQPQFQQFPQLGGPQFSPLQPQQFPQLQQQQQFVTNFGGQQQQTPINQAFGAQPQQQCGGFNNSGRFNNIGGFNNSGGPPLQPANPAVPQFGDNFGQPQSNIDDPHSPSAVSSTNNTEEPQPVSGLGLNQGSGKANAAETSVGVSPRKTDDGKTEIEPSQPSKQDLTKTRHDKTKKINKKTAIENIFKNAKTRFNKDILGKNLAQKGFGRKFFKTVKEYVKIDKLVDDLITEIYDTTDFKGKIFNDVKKISDLEKIVNKKITSKDIGLSAKGLCLMGVAYAYADYCKTESEKSEKSEKSKKSEKSDTAITILKQLPKTIKNLDRTGLRKTTLVTFIKQIKVLSEEVIKQYEWQQLT